MIGSGTVLDTGRFRYELGEHLGVDSRSVHAYIIRRTWDSELAAWSDARIGGLPIHDFCELRGHYDHDASRIGFQQCKKQCVRDHIQKARNLLWHRDGSLQNLFCHCAGERSIMPVSSLMTGEYGIQDVVLSIPSVVDANGIEAVVPIELSEKELDALRNSANVLKKIIQENS